MTKDKIIAEIDKIRDDAYWSSGCSHEDALKESLEDIEKALTDLIEKIDK